MEARGAVNCYEAAEFGVNPKEIYVINLSQGVTPFISFFGGKEYRSLCYRLRNVVKLTVTHAHYRPTKEEFDTLSDGMKDHVLNGGLCLSELEKARPLPDDPRVEKETYDQFQDFCEKTYGMRRPKEAWLP